MFEENQEQNNWQANVNAWEIAMIKGENKRGGTMIGFSILILILLYIMMSFPSSY